MPLHPLYVESYLMKLCRFPGVDSRPRSEWQPVAHIKVFSTRQ